MIGVIGSVALDVVGRADRLPGTDEAVRIRDLVHSWGGTAGNVAMALGRLGVPVRLIAAVGRDFGPSGYEAALRQRKVDLEDLVRLETPSAHAFQFSDGSHHQQIYFFPGQGDALSRATARPSRFLHACAGHFPAYEPHVALAEEVTLDFGQELFHRPFAEMEPLIAHADVVFLNRPERSRLESLGWPVERVLAAGARTVVETLGAEGALLRRAGGSVRVPGIAARALEPTGAGDAHRAGFLDGLHRGADDETSCRLGNVVAAFAVEGAGSQATLPDEAALAARYRAAYGDWPF